MSSDYAAKIKATAEAFVKDFEGDWQPDATMRFRAPECTHTLLPVTMGFPKTNNEEWAAVMKNTAPLIKGAKMVIDDYVGAPAERRAVCRSTLTATTPVGPYSCLYIWFFTFDESGEKVTSITEVMDSLTGTQQVAKFAEAGLYGKNK